MDRQDLYAVNPKGGCCTVDGRSMPLYRYFFCILGEIYSELRKRDHVALLTQSGALGIIEIEYLKNAISPKVIVSYGNQLDVDPCDLIKTFALLNGFNVHGNRVAVIANAGYEKTSEADNLGQLQIAEFIVSTGAGCYLR